MADLRSVAEQSWLQLGGGTDESRISLEEFIETAKVTYAQETLLWYWRERQMEGFFFLPSYLIAEVEKDVVDNEIDISDLKILRSLPNEIWLGNIGGLTCECEYIKSNVNHAQLLCDDDSLPDNARTFIIIGKKIKFPKGTHATKLPIIYATNGHNLDGSVEVEDGIAGMVRTRLVEIYGNRIAPSDQTNNSNPNN